MENPKPWLDQLDTGEAVNLTNCDREPIHIPNAIQPHGLLLVLNEDTFQIAQVSENARDILGVPATNLLGCVVSDYFGETCLPAIQSCLERNFEHTNPLVLTSIREGASHQHFNGIVHRAPSGEIVLELEPITTEMKQDFFQFYHQIKQSLGKMQTTPNLTALCHLMVEEVQRMTGFDRVMVYRFNDRGDGTVIAEAKLPHLETFLGLHYPDSDIPKQAKFLYTLNGLRLIPNVNYEASALFNPNDSPLLDMSYSVLRSVSPIHIEYLKNMGVAASMSISLIQAQTLWGLIACHHETPKFVPYEVRIVCEFLGQLMSTELATKEAQENLDYKLQLKDIQGGFVERLTHATDFAAELNAEPETLLKLTGANGAAVCQGDEISLIGETPTRSQVIALLTWLANRWERDIFVTDALPKSYPEAEAYKDVASGLLAMAISKIQRRYVLWFRPELLQTVNWAGNPEKPKRVAEDGTLTIFPRQSFTAWQEIVRLQSSAWLREEIDSAIALRQAIIDIVLRQSDELASLNAELDSFAYIASHDLKEPLRGIHNYATFLLEDYQDLLQAEGAEKLETLVRLTERMESLIESLLKFSRLGRQELQMQRIDLNRLLNNIMEVFQMTPRWQNCEIRIPQPLPQIWGDRALIEEVFTNLISNGFKYNQNEQKWVEVGWTQTPGRDFSDTITVYLRDNGIGIREKHLDSIFRIFKRLHAPGKYGGGTGAGLTIVKKIIERHQGKIRVESIYGQGTTFWLTFPH
ncbi:MAG: ATP-binding protein [Halothece sp. Uz-M2-17]|nr:ATP-binding protein [Halothece sp. Uz-M2-17]